MSFEKYCLVLEHAKCRKVMLGVKKDEYFNLENGFSRNITKRTCSEQILPLYNIAFYNNFIVDFDNEITLLENQILLIKHDVF
jgi:hypothetical protein